MKATKAKKTTEMPAGDAEKKKALDVAISHITKTYGAGSIMRLGENTAMSVSAIPTGSLTLDLALGIGGVPRGRIVEIYGPESSVRPPLPFILPPRHRSRAASPPSWMPSTPSILSMPRRWA